MTSLFFATPLAFNGGVTLGRSPQNIARTSKDGECTNWRRNIAESFNKGAQTLQTTDGFAIAKTRT